MQETPGTQARSPVIPVDPHPRVVGQHGRSADPDNLPLRTVAATQAPVAPAGQARGAPRRTLAHLLAKACRDHADRPAVVEGDKHLTYRQVGAQAASVADWLTASGLEAGARVGILSGNCAEYVVADVAIQLGGFTRVGLSARLNVAEVSYICADAGVAALFVDETWAQRADELFDAGPRPVLIAFGDTGSRVAQFDEISSGNAPDGQATLVGESAPALLAYTSGTTGRPKGATISQLAAFHTARNMALALPAIDGYESVLHTTPLAHFGFIVLLGSFAQGGTQHIMGAFDPGALLDQVERQLIEIVPLVPTQLNMVVEEQQRQPRKVGSIRCILYSASPIVPQRLRAAVEVFGPVFVQLYAQSEVLPPLTVLSSRDHELGLAGRAELLASAGRPLPYLDVMVADDNGREVRRGEMGEIVCRSEAMMDGYWRDSEQTSAAFTDDGWLRTGDIGRMTPDGYVSIVDRRKSMIITGGYNVYPAEIEPVIAELSWVREVCVIGIPHDHWGEAVTAVVAVDQDLAPDPNPNVQSELIIEHCRSRVAKYRVPKRVEHVTALPRSPVGKVLTRVVRETYWASSDRAI